ncbi:hypothetical protein TWF694_007726 [Orbilia ellipsospora]|uniref:Peptidase S8/S53 domain-containing protein n=1 Tax=Orbilia ellipsospora TaxID=2528407 RepID=A0AAV9XJ24_9PEZI
MRSLPLYSTVSLLISIAPINAIPTSESNSRFPILKRNVNATTIIQQSTAPWSLQRISSTNPIDLKGRNDIALNFKYRYDTRDTAEGVDVYIIGSGIDMLHPEFEGRAKTRFTAFPDDLWDISGHETLVGGIIGSTTYGVAKKASLWAFKIQTVEITDGPGQMPEFDPAMEANAAIKGLQAALKFHNKRKKQKDFKGSVMNLSWGYDKTEMPVVPGFDAKLREAMVNATKAGMHITIAPNNADFDACNNFPAGYVKDIPSLIVVGSTDVTDTRAKNSDWGTCIDLFAPGVNVTGPTSADWYRYEKTGPQFRADSGTSFAAPITAGVIASQLAKHPELRDDPLGMKKLILGQALKGVVKDTKGSPNLLLNTGIGGNPA